MTLAGWPKALVFIIPWLVGMGVIFYKLGEWIS